MELFILYAKALMLVVVLFMANCRQAESYDPLDSNGKIVVTFDIYQWTDDGYVARVTVENGYQYRHVEKPGWSLGWGWTKGEVIWSMTGAFATQQGNCSNFKFLRPQTPHCCTWNPVIVDLPPDAPAEKWTANCCRSGVLAAKAIDPLNSLSSFEIVVGNLPRGTAFKPFNVTLMAPDVAGYTCGPLTDEPPTITTVDGGKREEQVFKTWKSACTYSPFVANKQPACCVSLSTFYNPEITPCPVCACGCAILHSERPVCTGLGEFQPGDGFWCTNHMCPVRVHWHIKSNYRDYWRVKVTVSNYMLAYNHSDWNLVLQHPAFTQDMVTYSFNFTRLLTTGRMDNAFIFWGLQYYNAELLESKLEEPGSITTDILLRKDQDSFTLSNGWGFPRRVYFNGEECEMPSLVSYPGLPNTGSSLQDAPYLMLCLVFIAFCI